MQFVNRALAHMTRRGEDRVNAMLGRVGLRLMRTRNVVRDLRNVTEDPVHASYLSEGKAFVIDVGLAHCRSLSATAFPCTRESGNPFVDTLVLYAKGDCAAYAGSPLEAFYESWQPKSVAAVLGLTDDDASPLCAAPPLAFTFPWSALGLDDSQEAWKRMIEADNREHGATPKANLGWKAWGPVDPSIAKMEFERLVKIYKSITAEGYKRNPSWDGDIGGVALLRGEEFRVLIAAGHHRTAALAALGHSMVPVRFTHAAVRRSDVAAWPNVRSGLFTVEQALAVFDRVFDGRQPAISRSEAAATVSEVPA